MEKKTLYSRAFLIGHLQEKINMNKQENWQRKALINSADATDASSEYDIYENVCKYFYRSHVDAMQETAGAKRPRFLRSVQHYQHQPAPAADEISLPVSYDDPQSLKCVKTTYKFKIVALHVYTFPLGINFFAIEIDDSGNDLNSLNSGHFALRKWTKDAVKHIAQAVAPLSRLSRGGLDGLLRDQNKLKLYQVVMIDSAAVDDKVLYEIATSSPIGTVDTTSHYRPSTSYFNDIVEHNTVSAYDNWKAMALNDSFTYLASHCSTSGEASAIIQQKEHDNLKTWLESYFPLIYLRCLLEKTFCFTRNNMYRSGGGRKRLIGEIGKMEKYYFYDNISYNFLPNMLYKSMKQSMEIDMERKELTEQVKERESTWMAIVMAAIAAFAILSVFSDALTLFKMSPVWFAVAAVAFIGVCYYIYQRNRA